MISIDFSTETTHREPWGRPVLSGTEIAVGTVVFHFLVRRQTPAEIAAELGIAEAQVYEALRFRMRFERRRD